MMRHLAYGLKEYKKTDTFWCAFYLNTVLNILTNEYTERLKMDNKFFIFNHKFKKSISMTILVILM